MRSIRALREAHVTEAGGWANGLDLRAENMCKACLSFPPKTAIGLDQHANKHVAFLPDNILDSLGEIVKQCFVKLAKKGGSRTIAIRHTTFRLTMRLISALISQWLSCSLVSALKGNSSLRAHVVLRALSWSTDRMRKFYDSIEVRLLTPRSKFWLWVR